MIQAGNINEVNFYVIDEETGEEVHAESPRTSGSSPIGYESGYRTMPQFVDLDPGKYLVVVNTDIDDSVEKEIEVLMGQDVYASIPVGAFRSSSPIHRVVARYLSLFMTTICGPCWGGV